MKTTKTIVGHWKEEEEDSPLVVVEQRNMCPFIDNLKASVKRNGDKTFASWYNDKGLLVHSYTFRQMWEEAGNIAHIIRVQNGLQKGDCVVLCYSFGLQFFAAFLGCIRAGVLAVPVYPPNPQKLDKSLAKLNQIVQDCGASLILIDSLVNKLKFIEKVKSFFSFSGSADQWDFLNVPIQVHPEAVLGNHTASFDEESLIESDIAFLQYTSGSTGDPKGVMITFQSINANASSFIQLARDQFGNRGKSEEDIVAFSWLPQYHDMGLICAIVAPFLGGWDINFISPLDFVSNPMLWIQLMSKLGANWSAAPNFAYHLVAKKFLEARKKNPSFGNDLDLSSIVTLQSAAEPIQIETKEIFEEAFSDIGLPSTWFGSGYGLAENVAWTNALDHFKLSKFEQREGQPSVAVGHRIIGESPPGQIIKIISTESQLEVQDGEVGEIWISGPCVAGGYFGKPDLSRDTFEATLPSDVDIEKRRYLRTGDLGFYEDDYLYICGRQKDLIIINGENIYPQDVENVVQNASSGVKPGCIAAFAQSESGFGSELLEIIFEIRKSHEKKCEEVTGSVRMAVIEEIGLVPHRIVAIQERTIRKTTSGKIQRRANRAGLHDGSLMKVIVFDLIDHDGDRVKSISDGNQDHSERANDMRNHVQDDTPEDDADLDRGDVLYHKVVSSFLGNNVYMDKSWDELGLSSMVSIQLIDALSDHFGVTFDPDTFQKYTTPNLLRGYVLGFDGVPLKISLPALGFIPSKLLSWKLCGPIQFICSILLLLLFSFCIVPAWYVGAVINSHVSVPVSVLASDLVVQWGWVPIAIPTWMLAYSILVVTLKWILIGKYKEGFVQIPSIAYIRWWLVDRAVDVWEQWVGRLLLGTPLPTLFYFLMGANVHRSVIFDHFIREFDLVTISQNTSIKHRVCCRKFGRWNDGSAPPTLRFRPVVIEAECTVEGMLSPGTSVGIGTSIMKLSMVQEGAIVPARSIISGNPATASTRTSSVKRVHCWWRVAILKSLWLVFELYLFFATMLLGFFVWGGLIPSHWHYGPLLLWFLILVVWFPSASLVTSIVLKWVLIGKKKEGPFEDTILRSVADWAVDWHFTNASYIIYKLSYNSRVWNLILWMHGLDIDMQSKVFADSFLPSSADLLKVQGSFISVVTFETSSNGEHKRVEVSGSSVGYKNHFSNGAKVTNEIIPPLTHVSKDISGQNSAIDKKKAAVLGVVIAETKLAVCFLLTLGCFFASLIPSYELWARMIQPESKSGVVLSLALCLFVQLLSLLFLLVLYQGIALRRSKELSKPWSDSLYLAYQPMNTAFHSFTVLSFFLGSPTFNCMMTLLGVSFNGQALIFPSIMYEHCHVTVADKTIIDSSHVIGHYAVYDLITMGPCYVSGTVHMGSFVANAALTTSPVGEYGPSRSFVGTSTEKNSVPKDLETTETTRIVQMEEVLEDASFNC